MKEKTIAHLATYADRFFEGNQVIITPATRAFSGNTKDFNGFLKENLISFELRSPSITDSAFVDFAKSLSQSGIHFSVTYTDNDVAEWPDSDAYIALYTAQNSEDGLVVQKHDDDNWITIFE